MQLDTVEEVLRHAELCDDLREAVEALTGTLWIFALNVPTDNSSGLASFRTPNKKSPHETTCKSGLKTCAMGLLQRLASGNFSAARGLLDCALKIVLRFPVQGVPLAELAATAAGDSHALDTGQPLGTLVLRAAALMSEVDDTRDAEGRRDAWAGVGVLCDELSAPVLVLNLRGDARTLTGQALRLHAEHGEPYRLSMRQLLRDPPTLDIATVGPVVYVCENPTVVAAAAHRLGSRSVPLVCIEGQPKTAARLLLGQLTAAGIGLLYHGDFDWDGVRIANLVMKRHRASPWRLSADCYRAVSGGMPLAGNPVPASWDAGLFEAMTERNVAIHEELVLVELLDDLASSSRS